MLFRSTDSTYAYQGGGRQLNVSHIEQLENLVHGDMQPNLTLLLDAPVEVGRARAAKRGAFDRIEAEDLAFFNRVRDMFIQRSAEHERYCVVNANQPLDAVQESIGAALAQLKEKVDAL